MGGWLVGDLGVLVGWVGGYSDLAVLVRLVGVLVVLVGWVGGWWVI